MRSTAERMVDLLTCDDTVRDYLWTVANGDPVLPDGAVYDYNLSELVETVANMFSGETLNLPDDVRRRLARSAKLREKADAISPAEWDDLTMHEWSVVLGGLMGSLPAGTEIPCGYCGTQVLATEDEFEKHYMTTGCWNE